MGIFDGNTKKQIEELQSKIDALNQENEELKVKNSELSDNSLKLKEDILICERQINSEQFSNAKLQQEIYHLHGLLGDDEQPLLSAREQVSRLNSEAEKLEEEHATLTSQISQLESKLNVLKEQLIETDDLILLQSFGLYEPKYNFTTSDEYKEKLEKIRLEQEKCVKSGNAAVCLKIWSVEGSATKGKKLTDDNIKQIIRTFNIECDDIVMHVKFSNYDASKKRIERSFKTLNKLNETNKIVIQDEYLAYKLQELDLAFEYAQKKQEEKEELRRLRELRKEELRVAKELEEKRAEIEKEQQHYLNALKRIEEQLAVEKNESRIEILKQRKAEIEDGLADADAALKDLDYREANQRAGYVYVISNIGSFGENIYKIGMTRRLDPQDRVDELGGASVPFRFDVHAMIFSDDAPKLEAALHRAFENRKVNAINGRKEFFNVSLDEIEEVIRANHDKSVELVRYPEAQQYRESIKIRKQGGYIYDI